MTQERNQNRKCHTACFREWKLRGTLCVCVCLSLDTCWITLTTCALELLRVCRDVNAVENLLAMMSSVVQRHKKQLQLRNMWFEERVWKSNLNYSVAQAHLALLYQGLDQLHGGALQDRCTHKISTTGLDLFLELFICCITFIKWSKGLLNVWGKLLIADMLHAGLHHFLDIKCCFWNMNPNVVGFVFFIYVIWAFTEKIIQHIWHIHVCRPIILILFTACALFQLQPVKSCVFLSGRHWFPDVEELTAAAAWGFLRERHLACQSWGLHGCT